MATIISLYQDGKLVRYEPVLRVGELKNRALYLTPELANWMEKQLPNLEKDRARRLSPEEQVTKAFYEFTVGKKMNRSDLKLLFPHDKGLWEFKTIDMRVFSIFHRPNIVIAVCGEMKHVVKQKGYGHYLRWTRKMIGKLDLDEPKIDLRENLNALT